MTCESLRASRCQTSWSAFRKKSSARSITVSVNSVLHGCSSGPSRGPGGESSSPPAERSQYFTEVKPHFSLMEYLNASFFRQLTPEFYGSNRAYCCKRRGYLTFDTTQRVLTLD